MVLLCGQGILFVHELEHGLAGETDACTICLHASHDGNILFNSKIISAVPYGVIFNHHFPLIRHAGIFPLAPVARAPPLSSPV